MREKSRKNIAILGSTGSIGRQALELVRLFPDEFAAEVLTAQNNYSLLIEQSREFRPNAVVIGEHSHFKAVKEALEPLAIKVFAGPEALSQIVEMGSLDMVLVALVGFAGLQPTLQAIKAGKAIALANKETLVVAGELITQEARKAGVNIYPVDSEHSAIFQCLAGELFNPVEKIILTASGGPFREWSKADLARASSEQALKHPNWDMGYKVTIDSSTLMNKGLEVIEARWLFALRPDQIEVVVHPQSVIHSMVQFTDGSIKAQMGIPDMKLPILFAFSYPYRLKTDFQRFSFADYPSLNFEAPDTKRFRNLLLAYQALDRGGNSPCVLNAANEVAVEAFLSGRIGFLDMPGIIEDSLAQVAFIRKPSLEDYHESDKHARHIAESLIH